MTCGNGESVQGRAWVKDVECIAVSLEMTVKRGVSVIDTKHTNMT